jgi:hypothetical protein
MQSGVIAMRGRRSDRAAHPTASRSFEPDDGSSESLSAEQKALSSYNPPPMPEPIACDLCGKQIPPHLHYVVRIDVFADPSIPDMSAEELAAMDADATFEKLIEQMKHASAQELEDQVFKRVEYRICRACQREFLANPLGRPRTQHLGKN